MGVAASSGLSWHDVRDMPPPEIADLMVRAFDTSFSKHYQTVIDKAVGGGIVCSLGEQPFRSFMGDIGITLKPQQDLIIQALDELKRVTDRAVAALEESGSPYKHAVVRNLRTHNAAYVTFTKEGDTFRGATKFTKSLRHAINSAWDPPKARVTIPLRGSATLGVTGGPLLDEVARSLNVLWLLSAGSFEDPFCLMEVCAAVRQGTPVIPVRLAGARMRPLNLPIWKYSIAVKPSRSKPAAAAAATAAATATNAKAASNKMRPSPKNDRLPNADLCDGDNGKVVEQETAESRERTRRLHRRTVDGFYAQLAKGMPRRVQDELHRNNFLVKDVLAAVRVCFESAERGGDTGLELSSTPSTTEAVAAAATRKPLIFDVSAQPADHDQVFAALVGINSRKAREGRVAHEVDRGRESLSQWNWEQVPRNAPLVGRARVNDAVPWRTDEELSEMMQMETAEADDLAGLLVKDMLNHRGSENHQWEGCRGLAELAARDGDGLSAVRRQGGIQALLTALETCPKDADVQKWGCQALVSLFGDPNVASAFRQAGIGAVIRALALLGDVETALKSMGAGTRSVLWASSGSSKSPKLKTVSRERWARAMKKVEVGRVKEQRRASLAKQEAAVQSLEKEEAALVRIITKRRESFAQELQREIETEDARESVAGLAAAEMESGLTPEPDPEASLRAEGVRTGEAMAGRSGDEKNKPESRKAIEVPAPSSDTTDKGVGDAAKRKSDDRGDNERGDSEGKNCNEALAEEQRRLEELDRMEFEAKLARSKELKEKNTPDPWAMTNADIAIYNKAFIKQDKDKDGFISLREAKPMFDKARVSKETRRAIWKMADPYQRGKLTPHGWRVAYHLARSMKNRKLELPETLPRCLYPPGYEPVVAPPKVGTCIIGEVNTSKDQREAAGGEVDKGGGRSSVGGTVMGKDDETTAGVAFGTSTRKGKHEEEGKAQGTGKRDKSTRNTRNPPNTPDEKEGRREAKAGKTKKKRWVAEEGAETTAATNAVMVARKNSAPTGPSGKVDLTNEDDAKYQMNRVEKARYTEMFSKLVKGKAAKAIDDKKAAAILAKSGLKKKDLDHLWTIADADKDGKLSRHEFAVAMHLATLLKAGDPLPDVLPPCLVMDNTVPDERDGDRIAVTFERQTGVFGESGSALSSLGGSSDGSEKGDNAVGVGNTPRGEDGGLSSASPTSSGSTGTPETTAPDLKRGQQGDEEVTATTTKGEKGTEGEGEDREHKQEPGAQERKEVGFSGYEISDQDAARYEKIFDRLIKGKGTANLGGREAAAALAKSGLGKAELAQLWTISDVDRDGALSRVEFSIAMHLALCSTGRKLPVPSVLPENLAAMLAAVDKAMDGAAVASGRETKGEGTSESEGELKKHSATGSNTRGVKHKGGSIETRGAGGRNRGNEGVVIQVGERGSPLKAESRGADKTREAATAGTGSKPSRKRGLGVLLSYVGSTGANKPLAAEQGTSTSQPVSLADACDGKSNKRPKREGSREKTQQESELVPVATKKRKNLTTERERVERRSKPLVAKPSNNVTMDASDETTAAGQVGGAETAGESGDDSGECVGSQEQRERQHGRNSRSPHTFDKIADGRKGDGDGEKDCPAQGASVGGISVESGEEKAKKKTEKKNLCSGERDQLYAMTTSERAGYDVVFMQVGADQSGTIDGHEAGQLLRKSGLTREQLSTVWRLADTTGTGELDHDQWAIAMHLARCVAYKGLPLPGTLPRSLGGLDQDGSLDAGQQDGDGHGQQAKAPKVQDKGRQSQKGLAVKIREDTMAYRLGKITPAAFYITLASAFGVKRRAMIPKVARSLPLDKARALVAAADLGEDVLKEDEVAEARLQQLRQRRVDKVNLHVKSTTSGATARDVQLMACRLANRLCVTLDGERVGHGMSGKKKRATEGGGGGVGEKPTVAVEVASAGGVDAVALILRMFDALDSELMVEALHFALVLACACEAAPDCSVPKLTSLKPSSEALVLVDDANCSSPVSSLLRPLFAPSACKRVAEVATQLPHSRKAQRICCLLVDHLGSNCGPAARRCFADCCEPIVAAAGGSLDDYVSSDSDGSSMSGGVGNRFLMMRQGVREVACQALATLTQEPGLRHRLVSAGAIQAATHAMAAAPRDYDVQIACLETIAILTESIPGLWNDGHEGQKGGVQSVVIDAPCRRAVQSMQTFTRDSDIHKAASRVLLALLVGSAADNAARSVAAAGGATALSRVLATSPNDGEVQLPAVLAINKLLEWSNRIRSGNCANLVLTPTIERNDQVQAPPGVSTAAAETISRVPSSVPTVESELIAAAGCELLCKSAKTFPRNRELRLGCLKAMGLLCRGAHQAAANRLVAAGACQQLMKVVDAYPGDIEVRRAGLALLVGIAEHGEGTSAFGDDEGGSSDGGSSTSATTSSVVGALVNLLGLLGAVGFAAGWLREATAPVWAWLGSSTSDSSDTLERARDMLMSCNAAFLLTRNSMTNRDRFAAMGAIEALTRAVALSGRRSGFEQPGRNTITGEEGSMPSVQQLDSLELIRAETQVWAAQALAELAGGRNNVDRCATLLRQGALRALFAAMNRSDSQRQLQRAGCMALGQVAACLDPMELQALGRNGGAQAVSGAFKLCPGDKDVALAGLLAVAKLSVSSENRRLLGEAGVCPLVSKELLEFSECAAVAEEGCRAITRLAALSGFNRTAFGHAGAAEATAAALRNHPSKQIIQRWGLSASAALVAETDPSGNTDRIRNVGILALAVQALGKFRNNPTVQAEGLKLFAKVATSGDDTSGMDAVWDAGVVLITARALGLYVNDANVQHWGMATMRTLSGTDDKCVAWCSVEAPEAVIRTMTAFGKSGTGRMARHDEGPFAPATQARCCTVEESLCVQFQACAAALNLARSSPDARRRMVREGAGEALAGMMISNASNPTAQQGALATLSALSASGVENRKHLQRYKGNVPTAVVAALEAFPHDRRVRCEGALMVQNLSLTKGGAKAMTKAGAAPVIIRMLRNSLVEAEPATDTAASEAGLDGERTKGKGMPDRDVLVYALNGLANMAKADQSLSDFVGRHGACHAVVSALEQHPRDLHLQASGVKAARALALAGGRNVEVFASVKGPAAIVRAQRLFPRDREVQLACFGAAEALCRGGNRANRDALVDAGSIDLLEIGLDQFSSDAEIVAQGLRALVEIVLCGAKTGVLQQGCPEGTASVIMRADEHGCITGKKMRCDGDAKLEDLSSSSTRCSSSLPRLIKEGGGGTTASSTAALKLPRSTTSGEDSRGFHIADVCRGVEMVLVVLNRDPCREVCLSSFDALGRLLVNLGIMHSDSSGGGRATTPADNEQPAQGGGNVSNNDNISGYTSSSARLLRLAKIGQAVKRALKIHVGGNDAGLASRGRQILTLVAVARGRALAQ